MRLIDPFSLDCLLALAEEGTFRKAARTLKVTQSALSQRVSALETCVGAVLVRRARPLGLTAAGMAVLRHARRVQIVTAELERGLTELATARDAGEALTIAMDPAHASSWAWPALDRIARGSSKIAVLAPASDPAESMLSSGKVHGCITTDAKAPSGCESSGLGDLEYILAATPGYVQRELPRGLDATGATSLSLLVTGHDDHIESSFMKLLRHRTNVVWNRCTLAATELKAKGLLAGWGMAITSAASIAQAIARGHLVNVCPEHVLRMPIYWHRWSAGSAALDSLSDELAQTFTSMPRLTHRQEAGTPFWADSIEYQ